MILPNYGARVVCQINIGSHDIDGHLDLLIDISFNHLVIEFTQVSHLFHNAKKNKFLLMKEMDII